MFNFRCSYCDAELQGDYAYIGERVECPLCNSIQVLPDPIIPQGARFQGYKIEELLGSNLLWTTYKAEGQMKCTGKEVILRIPTTFFHKNVSDVQSFYDAVIKAGTLNMPEFPILLDRCLLTGKVYFAFELLNNFKSIAGLAKGKRLIEYHEALTIVRNVAKGLGNAWSSSLILHKNLKPSNILVDENCNVKILNIGIYDFLLKDYTLIRNGFSVWDCRYTSPEFMSSSSADSPASDIYSLGGVLYMLLTGRHPYDGMEPEAIPHAPPPSVQEFEPDCPANIANIVARMMDKDQQNRISKWEDLINALDIALIKMPQKRTPTLINMQIEVRQGLVEARGLKPTKYSAKKVFISPSKEKDEKQNLSNTLAKIVPQNFGSLESLPRKEKTEKDSTDSPKKHVSPGVIFAIAATITFALVFTFLLLKNPQKKISEEEKAVETVSSAKKTEKDSFAGEKKEKTETTDTKIQSPISEESKNTQTKVISPIQKEEQAIAKLIEKAGKIVSDKPEEIDEALKLLYEAKQKALLIKDFRLEQSIIDEILVLEEKKYQPIKNVLQDLATKANALIAKGEFDTAINLVKSYSGPYEKETEKERKSFVEDIIRQKNEALKKIAEQKNKSAEKLNEILPSYIKNIVDGDTDGFKLAIKDSLDTDLALVKDYAISLLNQADTYIKTPQLLRNYLQEKQDKSFEIKFLGQDTEKVKNLKLKDDVLTFRNDSISIPSAEKQAKIGQIDPDFILEKVLLIAPDSKDNEFLKALVYLRWGNYGKALENFNAMQYGCGIPLVKIIPDYRAKKEFLEILQICGIMVVPDGTNNLKIIADISKLELKQEQAEKIFSMLQNYRTNNSNTETFSSIKNIAEALEHQCLRADKKNRLLKQTIVQKGDKTTLGDALLEEIQNISGRATIKLTRGKYASSQKQNNVVFLSQKDISFTGEKGVEIEMDLEITGQNIEVSNLTFTGKSVFIRKTAKNVKIKNCMFSQAELIVDQVEGISFENCFLRQVSIRNAKEVSFSHCTLTTLKMAKAVIPLEIEGESIEVNDSIIYGDKYAVLFSGKGAPSKRRFNNTLIYGEEGLVVEKDQTDKIDEKNAVKKQSGLSKHCKVKNGIFTAPQFIDAANSNWALVPGTAGTKSAKDGSDIGVNWQVLLDNF